jgi:2-dehydropantoate 2-reductase
MNLKNDRASAMSNRYGKNDTKKAVIGAGAIGGVTAALMKKGGLDPILVCKHREVAEQISTHGIHVKGLRGVHTVSLKAVRDIEDLPEGIDIIFLATKANDAVSAAQAALPFLKTDSVVVSLQNGICEDALAEVVGRDRVIGCVVAWGATHMGPGELEVTSPGEFIIGNIDHKADARLESIKSIMEKVQPTRISSNIMGELFSKLIINSCINSLGVIAGLTLGELLAVKKMRYVFLQLMREAMAVAQARGIRVEPAAGGRLDYYRFLDSSGPLKRFKQHLMLRIIGFKYRRIKSSSLQSLERGRLTEIDFLNGYICEKAEEQDIPVPLNRAVVRMVHEIEKGERKMSLDNLNDLP